MANTPAPAATQVAVGTADQPADCHLCGFHAVGIGLSARAPYQWLCAECSLIIEDIRRMKRPDVYELKARQGGMTAAEPLVEKWGGDLSEYSEEQALMLCGAIWKGCAVELRRLIRAGEAPF